MDRRDRGALIAAALILGGFGIAAFILPRIVIAVGNYSAFAGALVAVAFVASFFGLFWLRSRKRR